MKKMYILSILLIPAFFTNAQILKRISDRAKEKVNQKIDQKVDKTIDDAVDGNGKKKTDKKLDSVKNASTSTAGNTGVSSTGSAETTASAETGTLKSYSKYDFVPGEKIIVEEDFAQDAVGDFPDKWNTNSSGEVVTVDGQAGHWLMIKKKGRFVPDYINSFPDNFTLQFDLISNEKFNFYSNPLQLYILTGENNKKVFEYSFIPLEKRSGVKFGFHPTNGANTGGTASAMSYEDGDQVINNEVATTQFNSLIAGKNKVKISIWRQKQRVRVYMNEEKVFDLPRAFAANKTYSTMLFEIWSGMNNDVDRYLINNIKMAVGAPDTRNKLITEGRFVTRGILFDVNSDRIKPESYGVLKEIGTVLTENAAVRVKIIGHTDADGDDKSNMDLSKRRAEAVKTALSKEFGVDASRMETDGKGESQPVDKNDSSAGKANNRRVEFVKL